MKENREEEEMLLEDTLFEQEWFSELSLRHRYLYIYLLVRANKRTGIFEINLRKMSYDLNDGIDVTRDDIFKTFGERIKPLGENKGIIVDYIYFNWLRKDEFDPVNKPLHKGIVNELAKYGLTIDSINNMATKKIRIREGSESVARLDTMFSEFWETYPSTCPRKVDKKKCYSKYTKIISESKDREKMHRDIINGLLGWNQSRIWNSDGGAYIKAPLVWLNGSCWEDHPVKGNGKNENNGNGIKRSDNSFTSNDSDINGLF